MSDQDDYSYYELALTQRQLVAAFIVVLGSLVVAFLAGVSAGREGSTGTDDRSAPTLASITEELPEGGDPMGSAGQVEPEASAPGEKTAEPTTLAEDLGVEAAEPPPREEQERPRKGRDRIAEAKPVPAPAPPPSPAPAPDPEPVTTPAPSPPSPKPAAPTSAESFIIQVFSSPNEDQAKELVQRLRDGGYASSISSAEIDGVVTHRVRIGPFSSRERADRVAGEVQNKYRLSTWVTAP